MSTLLLDLDALAAPTHHIVWKGANHHLVPLSVADFITNIREAQQADANRGLDGEAEMLANMLARNFPSIGVEGFLHIPVAGLWALLGTVQKLQGMDGAPPAKDGEANPQTAAADAS